MAIEPNSSTWREHLHVAREEDRLRAAEEDTWTRHAVESGGAIILAFALLVAAGIAVLMLL